MTMKEATCNGNGCNAVPPAGARTCQACRLASQLRADGAASRAPAPGKPISPAGSCEFTAGSLDCVKYDCRNPAHRVGMAEFERWLASTTEDFPAQGGAAPKETT